MASQRQIAANRANAQKSTGPKTVPGRAAVRNNAVRHGLTADLVVLHSEDSGPYDALLDDLRAHFNPQGPVESALVDQIAASQWRLRRAIGIEGGFFDLRQLKLEEELREDFQTVSNEASLAYAVHDDSRHADTLSKISRYHARIERSYYKALHELERLQTRRSGQHVPAPEVIDITVSGGETEPDPPPTAAAKQTHSGSPNGARRQADPGSPPSQPRIGATP
jgi:hypothetical protein